MNWRKWRSSPSLAHQADLESSKSQGDHLDQRLGGSIQRSNLDHRLGGPFGTLRKGECSCILCSFAPNSTVSSLKKSKTGTFPRSIRFPRIPPSLLQSSPSLISSGSSSSKSTSFFSSPRSSNSIPSSPCLRYMRRRQGKSRTLLGNSCERYKDEGRRWTSNSCERGRNPREGRLEKLERGPPRRWHSVQSLFCLKRLVRTIQSNLSLP